MLKYIRPAGGVLLALLLATTAACMRAKQAARAGESAAPVVARPGTPAARPAAARVSARPLPPRAELPDTAWLPGADCLVFADAGDFTPAGNAGTTLRAAAVVAIPCAGGKLRAALDADAPGAPYPTLLRFDAAGSGSFAKGPVAVFERVVADRKGCTAEVRPLRFTATVGGRALPLTVGGWYRQEGTTRRLTLRVAAAVAGTCAFGDRTHAVRLLDGNGNLKLGDALAALPETKDPAALRRALQSADILQVDLADGKFRTVAENCFGQPVYVDGAWYAVALDGPDAFAARPLRAAQGSATLDEPTRQGLLVGRDYLLPLAGLPETAQLPVDRYRWAPLRPAAAATRPSTVYRARRAPGAVLDAACAVAATGVARIAVGSLAIVFVGVQQNGRNLYFNLAFASPLGAPGEEAGIPDGMPASVAFEVVDAAGQVVQRDTFEHG